MTSLPGVYTLDDPNTFAYITARQRWSKIFERCKVDILDHIKESNVDSNSELSKQGDIIIKNIDIIVKDILSDQKVEKFTDEDIKLIPSLKSYNDKLDELNAPTSYLQGP